MAASFGPQMPVLVLKPDGFSVAVMEGSCDVSGSIWCISAKVDSS